MIGVGETNTENLQRYLEMPISVLELSARSHNVLSIYDLEHANKIRNLRDLIQLTESDLLSMIGMGRVSLRETKEKLLKYGLNLKEEPLRYTKKRKIVELAKQGLTREQIAEKAETSYRYVIDIVLSEKLTVPRQMPRQTKQGKINSSEIDSLIAQGRKLKEIADKLKVTKQAVAQYIERTDQHDLWRENRAKQREPRDLL